VRRETIGFEDLLVQMKITNRLLAAQLRSQMKQNDLIALLATTGASVREIADVVNTTPATVTTTLARLKLRKGSAGSRTAPAEGSNKEL
jgi:DNA-binding MarR family transcriptional regulator